MMKIDPISEENMEPYSLKIEKVSSDELQQFYDSLSNNLQTKCDFTIDYFDTSLGILFSRENPTSLNFGVAVLHEVLCNLKPSHELWDKIKYAAFLLNLATRGIDFSLLYDIYHQVELEANLKHLSWREKEIKKAFEEKVVEKLEVKVDESGLEDYQESKNKIPSFPEVYYADNLPEFDKEFNFTNHKQNSLKRKAKSTLKNGKRKASLGKKKALLENKSESALGEFKPATKEEQTEDSINSLASRTKYFEPDFEPGDDEDGDYEDYHDEVDDQEVDQKDFKRAEAKIKAVKKIKKEKGKPGRKRKMDWEMTPCPLCDFQAKNNHFLDKHTFEEHEASRLCTQCGYLTISFKDFVAHNQTHLWTCEICKKKILGMKGFRWHMRRHKSETVEKKEVIKVPCDICGVFMLEKSLKHHHMNDHSEETFKCDLCDYTGNSKYKVAVHRKRHFIKQTNCPECGKVVKDLKSHFRRKCGNSKVKERFFCHLCEKSFSLKHGLDRHIKNIHQRICGFHCDMCEYKTYDNYNLKLHISKNHTKEGMEKICQYCNQKTGSLEHHIKIYHYEDQMKLGKTTRD